MICVTVTDQLMYRVEYHLANTRVVVVECAELTTALNEVKTKMMMDWAHAKGKTVRLTTGREI